MTRPCPKVILAPCCSSWFHRGCIQKMGLNSGSHHFKCPLCNNNAKFTQEMLQFGIYLPQKDASWEEDGSFNSEEQRMKMCGAKICFCEKEQGRKYNYPDGLWELMSCHACGSSAIHVKCGGMDEFVDPQWHCYLCRRIVRSDEENKKRQMRPINEVWGTALAKRPKKPRIEASLQPPSSITTATAMNSSSAEIILKPPINGKIDYSNTVTITPIPKHQIKPQHSSFPMKSESSGGVEIRMVVPIKESPKNQEPKSPNNEQDTIRLSLEDIIIAGLSKKPRETNYKCTKAFAEQYDQPRTTKGTIKRGSLDTEQEGSPGDSDYESAQEAGLPFKIRKQAIILTNPKNSVKKPQQTPPTNPPKTEEVKTAADKIDLKIQKSIKDFFQAS